MEYAIGSGSYTQAASPDLSGNKTVKVRIKAAGINPASADTTLTFTTNVSGGGGTGGGGGNREASVAPEVLTVIPVQSTTITVISEAEQKAAAAKAEADAAAKAKVEAAAKAAAEAAAAAKASADKLAADQVAAVQRKAAAVVVVPAVTKSGTKLALDLPDKYYGQIVTIYLGTTVKGKTTFKKLDFFVLDKLDATATVTSKVKLAKDQIIQVKLGSLAIYTAKVVKVGATTIQTAIIK